MLSKGLQKTRSTVSTPCVSLDEGPLLMLTHKKNACVLLPQGHHQLGEGRDRM